MSSTPTVTSVVQSEVSALAHRHLTLTYSLVGTIILLLALMGFGGYLGLKSFDAQLARAEQRDAQYQQDRKVFMDTLAAHDAERAVDAQKIADLQAQIAHRDAKPLPPAVQAGLQPGASLQEAKTALETVMAGTPSFGALTIDPAGNVAPSVPQLQQLVSDESGYGICRLDLADEKSTISLLNTANYSLTKDLEASKALNVKAESDIAGFKKLAKKSRWQKFMSGAEKAGLFVAGVYAGHKL